MSTMTTIQAPPRPPQAPPSSSRPYWLGGLLIAVGVIGAVVWAVLAYAGMQRQIDDFTRMAVPGSAVVTVDSSSTQVLYAEGIRGAPLVVPAGIRVTDPSGAPVRIRGYDHGDLRYDVPGESGRVGRAVAEFDADAQGDYRVVARGASAGASLAVGADLYQAVVWHLVGAGLFGLVLAGGGLTLVVVTAGRRRRTTV